jgi:Protein of unknown function (DUF4019)
MASYVRSAVLSALFIVALIGAGPGPASAQQKPEELAQQSAETWLALSDAGKYDESYAQSAQYFQKAVPKAQWNSSMHAVRDPLGSVTMRKLKSATYTKTLPGAPDGEYVVLRYGTTFEHKQSAIETITPLLEADGKWKVSGYFIQ